MRDLIIRVDGLSRGWCQALTAFLNPDANASKYAFIAGYRKFSSHQVNFPAKTNTMIRTKSWKIGEFGLNEKL